MLDTTSLSSSPSTSLDLVSWQQDVPRWGKLCAKLFIRNLAQAWDEGGLGVCELPQPTAAELVRDDNILRDQGQGDRENQVNITLSSPLIKSNARLIETNSLVLRPNVVYPKTTNPTLLAEVHIKNRRIDLWPEFFTFTDSWKRCHLCSKNGSLKTSHQVLWSTERI